MEQTDDISLEKHVDKFDKRNYFAMLVSWIILAPTWTITVPYFQHYILALGGNEYIVGLIAAISGYTLATVRIIGGYLTDVVGRKKIIVLFTYVLSATYLLFYIAWDWKIVLIASVISSLALIYQPALNAIVADSLPKEYRGRGLGLINLANGLSGLLAIYVALLLVSIYGIIGGVRWGYLISFFLILIAAIIRHIFLRETIKVENLNEIEDVVSDFVEDYKFALKWIFKHLKHIMVIAFILNLIAGITYLLPLYVTYYLNFGKEIWGYFYLFIFGVQLAFSIPSGYISDILGRKIAIIISTITTGIGNLILYLLGTGKLQISTPMITLFTAGIFLGIGGSLSFPAIQSVLADLTVPKVRGKISALFGFIMNVSLSTGQLVSGYIYYEYAPPLIFLVSTLISIIALAYASMKLGETVKIEKKEKNTEKSN